MTEHVHKREADAYVDIDGHTPLCSMCKRKSAPKGAQELTIVSSTPRNKNERQCPQSLAPSYHAPQHIGLLNQDSLMTSTAEQTFGRGRNSNK
jgi:hypothetical protein